MILFPLAAQGKPVHNGHEDVRNDQSGRGLTRFFKCVDTVGSQFHLIPAAAEQNLGHVAVLAIVVYHKQFGHVVSPSI
jgi:hypothetical protein